MPPKRKRVEDSASTTTASSSRPTRSSTRIQAKNDAPIATHETAAGLTPTEPATKRKRTTKAPATPKKAPGLKKSTKRGDKSVDDDVKVAHVSRAQTSALPVKAQAQSSQTNGRSSHPLPNDNTSPTSSIPTQQEVIRAATPPPQSAQPPASLKVQPYTSQRSLALFTTYADSDNPNVIGPEGFEQLCMESGVPLEGALPLILAWQLDSKEMAKITKDEWVKGMETLKIASLPALATALNDLQNMLIMKQGAVQKSGGKKDHEVYDKTLYHSYAQDPKIAFGKLYSYCFTLAKPEGSRNIDMETSCAFWSVLLVPQYPIMKEVLEFLNEKRTYKATHKDLWSMMLEFCETVDPSLQDYEADGAWPTLLDDFVSWRNSKGGAAEGVC